VPPNPASDGGVFCVYKLLGFADLHGVKPLLAKYRAELIVGGIVFIALLLKDLF
jgi:hypothetical protein